MDDSSRLARYANWFNVGHNNFEFVIDFGQHHAGEESPLVHTRIVLSPAYAKVLGELLTESLLTYEQTFGDIPDVEGEDRKC